MVCERISFLKKFRCFSKHNKKTLTWITKCQIKKVSKLDTFFIYSAEIFARHTVFPFHDTKLFICSLFPFSSVEVS